MGGKSSKEEKDKLMNSTKFRNHIKKVDKIINDLTASMMQSTLTTADGATEVNQDVTIQDVTGEDVDISGVSLEADAILNLSVMVDNKMKDKMVQDLTSQLQNKISSVSNATQKQLDQQQEQAISSVVGGIADTMTSLGTTVGGGKHTEKSNRSVKNLLNIDNDNEMDSLVKKSINVNLVNQTVNTVSNKLLGHQKILIQNVHAKAKKKGSGRVQIANINEKFVSKQITDIITQSDMSESVISAMTVFSKTEVSNMTTGSLEQQEDKTGTIQDVTKTLGDTISSVAKTGIWAILMPMILIAVVIIAIVFVVGPILPALLGGSQPEPSTKGAEPSTQGGNGPDWVDWSPRFAGQKMQAARKKACQVINQTHSLTDQALGGVLGDTGVKLVTVTAVALISYLAVQTVFELYHWAALQLKEPFEEDEPHYLQVMMPSNFSHDTLGGHFVSANGNELMISEYSRAMIRLHFLGQNGPDVKQPSRNVYIRLVNTDNYLSYDIDQNNFRFLPFRVEAADTFTFQFEPVLKGKHSNSFRLRHRSVFISFLGGARLVGDRDKKNAIIMKAVSADKNLK
jgi:hypothetical protein